MRQTVTVDGSEIAYEVVFSRRTTLALQVERSGLVRVRAPLRTPAARIAALVAERAAWIRKHQERFKALPPRDPSPTYASGDQVWLLGVAYRLVVGVGTTEQVAVAGSALQVTARTAEPARVAQLIERWYRAEAQRVFPERLAACWPLVAPLGVAYPTLSFRRMRSRWGSCSHDGRIRLSLHLLEAPVALIDYVLLHELCHLREHNHSPRFYALLGAVLPDWRDRRRALAALH